MKTVEYKKDMPAGLKVGRNKFVGENGKVVRVDVERIQLGAQSPERIAELKSIENMKQEDIDKLDPKVIKDYQKKKGWFSNLLARFAGEDNLRNGFVGYKIVRRER